MRLLLLIIIAICIDTSAFSQTRDLNYYINQATANSPLLKSYRNQYFSGLIDSQRIAANYKPQVTATSNDVYAPVINGYGYDPIITNIGNYNALLNVNQTFAGKKNLQTQYAATRLQNDSLLTAADISVQDLKRTITAQYVTAYGDLQQLNLNNEVNTLLRNEDTILRKLTENNIYRQTDYLTFKVTLQQQELQFRQLHIQYQTDFATLNYLCGIYDTSSAQLSKPDINLNQLPDVANSIFLKQYYIDSLKLQNSISLVDYSYRPKVNAFVNGGFYSSLLFESYKNFGGSVGLNLTVPIYDGHQRKLQIKQLKLEENSRLNYQDFFIAQHNQQIAQLMQQLHATEGLMDGINEQIKYAETLIKVDGKLMETGDTRIADFVIAINNYLNANNLLTQNNISRMQIINQLNYWNK